MDSLLVAEQETRSTPSRLLPSPRLTPWLIITFYFAAAVVMTSRLWVHPSQMGPTTFGNGVNMDVYLSTWYMRYAADCLAHGHLPALVTTAINAPQGVNAMWNTSLLAPAVLLTPVTLIAGPVVSLNVLLTLGFAGSATAMFLVLRRWQVGTAGAAIGGAFYAFMPALMVAAQDHYHLQFAVLPPLIIDAVLMLVTGRGRPIRTGLWLGVLVAIQLFTAEEMLAETAIVVVVLLILLVASRPRAAFDRAAEALVGLGVAMALALVLCARGLWVQFHGPLAEYGSPWKVAKYGNPPAAFVTAPSSVLIHGHYQNFLATTGVHAIENFAYLGWPLQIALFALPFIFWRDLRIRVIGLAALILELLSMGGHAQRLDGLLIEPSGLPWHYLRTLPVLGQMIASRLSIMTELLAAAVVALAAERVIALVRAQDGWRRPAFASAAIVSLVAIVVPLIPRPVPAGPVTPPPNGWTTVISKLHIPAGGSVLVLPFNQANTMEWQALTNENISVVEGYCIAPDPAGRATKCGNKPMLTKPQRWVSVGISRIERWIIKYGEPDPNTLASAVRSWHPDAVIITAGYNELLVDYMTGFFGQPQAHSDYVMGWRTGPGWYATLAARLKAIHAAYEAGLGQHKHPSRLAPPAKPGSQAS